MKHLVLTTAVIGLFGWAVADSQACHRRGSCGGAEACGSAPCETVVAAPAAPAAPVAPQYVEQKVTTYKCVQKEREVQEVVCRMVPREEKYNYTVMVPVTKQETRKETYYRSVPKQVEYTATVMVPVTTQEKRKVTECQMTHKEVEFKYTVMVPKTTQEKRTVSYCEIERRQQEVTVPVCRTVQVQCQDECGNCYTRCQRVVEHQKVMREICVPVHKTKEVMVNVTVCEAQERVGKRTVCQPVMTEKEILVNVTRCQAEQRKFTKTVCEMVAETRDVTYNVTSCEAQQRTGTRTVYDTKHETVTRKVLYNEMVPETTTVRVPVSQCVEACDSGSSHGHGHRGGLFRRCR
jgi:hypothetical protein